MPIFLLISAGKIASIVLFVLAFQIAVEIILRTQLRVRKIWMKSVFILSGSLVGFVFSAATFYILNHQHLVLPGPVIGEVDPESLAEKAGLLPGDRITSINGSVTKTWFDVEASLQRGSEIRIEYQRQGKTYSASTITADFGKIGISYLEVPPILTFVLPDSILLKSGFTTGDAIREIRSPQSVIYPRNYFEFVHTLMKLRADGAENIQIFTRSNKEITIDPRSFPNPASSTFRDYAKLLGFRDSQLTIAEIKEKDASALHANDLITAWNNHFVFSQSDLNESLRIQKSSDSNVTILRNFQRISTSLKIQSNHLPFTFLGSSFLPKNSPIEEMDLFSATVNNLKDQILNLPRNILASLRPLPVSELKEVRFMESKHFMLNALAELSFIFGVFYFLFGLIRILRHKKQS